ncbi:MAG: BlaI/MecI/CopY family transcriptional regulator [Clostridia bacterium]|nr:BlaI/MecI/CopY family transcriptional regulator [Oscillospiraceae bacterium]MBQ2746755.1 BlaI/MecI/CopY family transcriptional regulator [Clostridia bacterium]
MQEIKLGIVETHFANIVWDTSPISSPELVKICEKELGWKKSTTYTVLKKLCDRGIFENKSGTVVTKIDREEFYSIQSEKFVDQAFDGSLPSFIAAFTNRRKLSREEVAEIKKMIEHIGD